MRNLNKLAWTLSLMAMISCGSSKSDDKAKDDTGETAGDDLTVDDEAPSDSTGANGTVSLGFGTQAAALWLDDAAATLKIGDSIVLDQALFNVAKIKVKASKDENEKEKKLEEHENASEKTAAAEIETTTADSGDAKPADKDGAGDHGGSGKSGKEMKEHKIAALKAKKDELSKKDHDQLDKEVKHDKATRFAGPFVYDAIAGKFEGDGPKVDIADGSYRRVEFQLKRSYDDRMLGDVFYLHGTVTKDGAAVPFEISWHSSLNFRLRGDKAFAVVAGAENPLGVVFDVATWFEGIDLTTATVDADGTIYINKDSNRAFLKQLHHNIKVNTRFGKADKDGKVTDAAGQGEDVADAEDPAA